MDLQKETSPKKTSKEPNQSKKEQKPNGKDKVKLTFAERLHLPNQDPDKIYKGLFISKLRKKNGDAGRIKAPQFKCKIDLRFNNGALHQSDVYWREFSRRQIKKPENKQKPKYVQKKQQQPKAVTSNQPQNSHNNQQKETSQQKIIQKIGNLKIESQGNNIEPIDQDKEKQQTQSLDESEQEEDYVINARVVDILDCPHEHRNIVCTIVLSRNKYKPSDHKDFLVSLEDDYYIDVYPINPRLERFTVKNLQPLRKLIPKDRNQSLRFFDRHYFSIKFVEWDSRDKYPIGKIVKKVSQGFTPEGQSQALLQQFELVGYDETSQGKQIALQTTPQHKDHRNLFVFTIDPATSTDLDDALSIQTVGNDYQVGIHIADVTSYLHLLDRQKLCRLSTSTYLPYTAKHMLSPDFVKICSLDPNVDRLAYSIFVILNEKGEVKSVKFQKTVIHSVAKLAYENAQRVIQNKDPEFPSYVNETNSVKLKQKIILLNKLAQARRSQRTFVDLFNNSEIKFQLDEKNYPKDIRKQQRQESNKLVQQFMLLGNQLVAKKLVQCLPEDALIIHHPVPSKTNRDFFNKMFEDYGFQLNFQNMKQLQQNIMKFVQNSKQKTVKELVTMKATRMQELASYKRVTKESQGHFALGMQSYTHFTSPMRRFSDIIAAQQLMKCLSSQKPIKLSVEEREKLDSEIDILNLKRKATKRLKSMILEKFIGLMIDYRNCCLQTEAIIVSYGVSSGTILIADYDLQKQIFWKSDLDVVDVRQRQKQLQITFYSNKKRVTWKVKKHEQIKVKIDCTRILPFELVFNIIAQIDGKEHVIRAFRS